MSNAEKAIHTQITNPKPLAHPPNLEGTAQKLVSSVAKNTSILSKIASAWGEMSIWFKLFFGVVITLPLLITAIVLQLHFLYAICAVVALVYAVGSFILDNHYKNTVHMTNELKNGLLEMTKYLADAITRFTNENENLKDNIAQLQQERMNLEGQISELTDVKNLLSCEAEALKKTSSEFKESAIHYEQLFTDHEQNSRQIHQELLEANDSLHEKIDGLTTLNQELQKYKEETAEQLIRLQTLTTTLTSQIGLDNSQQEEFKKQLHKFITEGDNTFTGIAKKTQEAQKQLADSQAKLQQTEEQLATVKQELKVLTQLLATQVKEQGCQIESLKEVTHTISSFGKSPHSFHFQQAMDDKGQTSTFSNSTAPMH